LFSSRSTLVSKREFRSKEQAWQARDFHRMAKMDEAHRLSWPWWAPRALLGVAVTSVLTIAATLYDIL
jgi:hypothetical protein